ncbi:hypothetical protein [Kocuria palustris]|uniref:hypothetical protein n=1 Tax=Kocuria palustris TaxID=71999 RepID=UPI003BF89FAA
MWHQPDGDTEHTDEPAAAAGQTDFADGGALYFTGESGAGLTLYEGEHVVTPSASVEQARAALQRRYQAGDA